MELSAIDIIVRYRAELMQGLSITLMLCIYIWSIGVVAGVALGAAGARWRAVAVTSKIASFVLSGIPVLVFLFWLHYPVQYMLGIVVDPFITTVVALAMINVLLVADLVRGVLIDFPRQYLQAARVNGLTAQQTLQRVQLPIIYRQVLPGLLTIQIVMLQSTLFASLISVDEIFRIAQRINSEVYRPVEVYTALGVLFLAICLPMHGFAHWLRVRFTRDLSER